MVACVRRWLGRAAALVRFGGWGRGLAPARQALAARTAHFPQSLKPRLARLPGWGLALALLVSCARATPTPQVFDGQRAYAWVEQQCALGPRVTGSAARDAAAELIRTALTAQGWTVEEQVFTYRGVTVRNVLAWRGEGPATLLGAHYDSRAAADQEDPSQPVLGANDGASGVAVLLELARVLELDWTRQRVYLAFFDAEDNGELQGWPWSVGAEYMAASWTEEGRPPLSRVVVVDMVGDADLQLFYDGHSDAELRAALWSLAAELRYTAFVPQVKYFMIDDHLPFAQRGIPAVDVIDFDYPYWHTTQDTPDKVSAASLEAVGRVLETWLERDAGMPASRP